MKKQTILLSALALTMLASCEKEVIETPQKQTKAEISLLLGQYGPTKGLGTPTTATQVAVGLNFSVESFITNASQGTSKMDFVRTGVTNEYTATADVNAAATKIKLIGNYDGSVVDGVTLTPNVNTRQGDMSKEVVLVSGEGNITGTPEAKTAAVSVAPEMARIEIKGDNTDANLDNIKNVYIKAIYLNNVKLDRSATTLTRTRGLAAFNEVYGAKEDAKAVKYALVDKHPSTGWQIVDGTFGRIDDAFTGGKAIGYNMFSQPGGDVTDLHPHVNIELAYDERITGDEFAPKTGYLNIKAFKENGGTKVATFEAGKVYVFTVNDITSLINDPSTPITPEPEPETGSVEITCTVLAWTLVPVTPEV